MLQDLRLTLRRLRQAPGYFGAIVCILAIGIGVATAMFNVLYALAWRTVQVPNPSSLVAVSTINARGVERVMPLSTLTHLQQSQISQSAWCAYNAITETTSADNRVLDAYVALLSADCPDTLRVSPQLGRWFRPQEVRLAGPSEYVALISHAYWQRAFNKDPAVVGRTIRVFNATLEVIGVLPPAFRGLSKDYDTDIFVPFNAHRPASNALVFLTRLGGGESIATLAARAATAWPSILQSVLPPGPTLQQTINDVRPNVRAASRGFSRLRDLYGRSAAGLAALAGSLLMLICINVGGLFVSRWLERSNEVATLFAVGADTARIGRLILAEASVIVLTGSAMGLIVATLIADVLQRAFPVGVLPWSIELRPDRYTIAGALAVSLMTMPVLMAAWPVWKLARLRQGISTERTISRRVGVAGRALIVSQVAIAVCLIFATTLIVRSLDSLWKVDRGIRSERILSARLFPNPGAYERLNQQQYYPELIRQLEQLPGVKSVGAARYFGSIDVVLTSGQPVAIEGNSPTTNGFLEYISPNFFSTLGVPILYGRDVAWTDTPTNSPVAVVSESLARALGSHGSDLIGRALRLGSGPSATRLVIVGVVGNISLGNFRQADHRLIFRSGVQADQATMGTVHLRADTLSHSLSKAVTDVVSSFGVEHVIGPYELDRFFSNSLVAERLGASVGVAEALVSVFVCCLGLYVLVAQNVTARRREIGIRLALGATITSVWARLVAENLVWLGLGVLIGYPAAIGVSSLVQSLLFGIGATDFVTFALCATMMVVSGLLAAMIPARRISRIAPAVVLRQP